MNSKSIESRNGYHGEFIDRKCLCKRSQTDPGMTDFGSRRVNKNDIGLWLYILYYYFSIQYYQFSLSEEKVVRGEKPLGHSKVIRAVLRIRSASKYTIVDRPNSYSYYFREFPILFANPLWIHYLFRVMDEVTINSLYVSRNEYWSIICFENYDLIVFPRNYYKNIIFSQNHYLICEFTFNSLSHVLAKLNGIFKIGQFKEHFLSPKEIEWWNC